MDPLSAASGIAGLLAFSIELGKMASAAKTAVEQFKSAPSEVAELADKLALLETVCKLVEATLAARQSMPGASSQASCSAISTALAHCYKKMEGLAHTLSATGLATAHKKSETASRLRFILHKEKLNSLIREIGDSVSLLQFVINMDMWMTTSFTPPDLACCSQEGIGPQNSPGDRLLVSDGLDSEQSKPVADFRTAMLKARTAVRTQHQFQSFGPITWKTTVTEIDPECEDEEPKRYSSGVIGFRLPFTSLRIDLRYHQLIGMPSYALVTTHVIDSSTDLGQVLAYLFFVRMDLMQLKTMLSKRQLSIYSVWTASIRNSPQISLLHLAVMSRWTEALRFLLRQDVGNKLLEAEVTSSSAYLSPDKSFSTSVTCETTETLLSLRHDEARLDEIELLIQTERNPAYIITYLQRFFKLPMIDQEELVNSTWKHLVSLFARTFDRRTQPCSNLTDTQIEHQIAHYHEAFRILIERGVDVHQSIVHSSMPDYSAYVHILEVNQNAFGVDEAIFSWLEILRKCGVSVAKYLRRESPMIRRCFGELDVDRHRRKRLAMINVNGLVALSWRWHYGPQTAGREVLQEFSHFVLMETRVAPDINGCVIAAGVETWMSFHQRCSEVLYPFILRNLDCHFWGEGPESYQLAHEIREERFLRREEKKWGKCQTETKMPGSWVD